MKSSEPKGEGIKILLVEDDPAQLRILQMALHQHDYHCAVFTTAEEAIENCEPSLLGAAILDMDLPGMDGIELGRQLKEMAGRDVFLPVIMVSGTTLMDDRVRGFRAGCDDFLTKPINHFDLSVRLESLIARRDQQAELVRVNAALLRAQERRSELAALIVHDLRNPLAAIMGNVQLLEESSDPEDSLQQQCLRDLEELSHKSLSMIDGLLDVEELEEGLLKADCLEIDLEEFTGNFPGFYETSTRARKLELSVEVNSGLRARFDRQLIGRIVENLLDNAVRYAKRKGKVVLRAYSEDEDLVIEVGNTGPEIPKLERERMFERYYRLEARRSGARANRGLGLYFCRLAAAAHQGSIRVESRADFPACFVLRLPTCVVLDPSTVSDSSASESLSDSGVSAKASSEALRDNR